MTVTKMIELIQVVLIFVSLMFLVFALIFFLFGSPDEFE